MGPVLPVHVALIDQLDVGLVDERCGLERALAPLAPGVARRDDVQLVIDDRNQALKGRLVPRLPVAKQPSDVGSL
jgi:hypothetical protein